MTEQQSLGSMTVTQVGIVVKEMDPILDHYCQVFGLKERPQIIVTDGQEVAQTMLYGKPSPARARLAFINMGQVQIELIEPDGNPSTWQEHLDKHGDSVHHIAFQIQGTDKVVEFLQGQGIPLAQQGHYTGGMYSYVNSMPQLGVILELLENF